jgi:hypothetical protein
MATRVAVKPDGSGTYSMTVSEEDASGKTGDAFYEAVRDAVIKSKLPMKVTRYANGNQRGAELAFKFLSLKDLENYSRRLSSKGNGVGALTISRSSTGWNAVSTPVQSALNTDPAKSPFGQLAFGKTLHLTVSVDLPGAPAANNATGVTNSPTTSTFSWDVPFDRPPTPLQASTTFVGDQASVKLASALTPGVIGSASKSDKSSTGLIVIVLAVAVVATGAVIFYVRRRRSQTGEASAAVTAR